MKEFVEKLIGRLEEEISWYETHGCNEDLKRGIIGANRHAISIVNQLAEEYNNKDCSKCSRRSWYQKGYKDAEKKFAEEMGVSKMENTTWIPCSERLPSREEYQKCNGQFIVSDGNRTYATYFDIYDTLKFGEPTIERFRIDKCVIAWQPLPAPYQKGE